MEKQTKVVEYQREKQIKAIEEDEKQLVEVESDELFKNLLTFFSLSEKSIQCFRDRSVLLSEAKYKAKYGKGPKILTPKQML